MPGREIIEEGRTSLSASKAPSVTLRGVFVRVVTFCDLATGGVFIGVMLLTVIETLAALLVEDPSLAVNVKLSDPVYPRSGV